VSDEIISSGSATHAYFGMSVSPVRAGTGPNGGGTSGLLVVSVVPGGPAAQAGLQAGDVITTINGEPATSADQLYAIEKRRIPGLKLVKLGCGGETTTSFLTGHGNAGDALLLGCDPAGGSQMVAAERFLREHRRRGEVAMLTLDIGANDIDGCEAEDAIDANCVIRGADHISANLPVILRRLRRAAAPDIINRLM